jgi:hypothetical protein
VTVVGATIVFAPGTTRWVVQSTPGLTLDEVIYTNQTGADVPEAVLLESAPGGDLQLRGVTDGRTTSITPISGDRPAQTMGDSFGGVILVQTVDTHSVLQRVGFTPDVLPWRWLSNGSVSRVVQTHDGTIFATERVVDGQGMLSAAAVVVLEGATGALRARVPIPTSTHYDHWVSDGSSNCAAQERDIRDGIGLSDQWALTTADVYGVIAVDEDQASDNCSAPNEYQGHIFRTQYLLTVDRDGGSTSTQVSQFNAVFPSSSGNSSQPEANGLSADASGNLVVSYANNEEQLFGPSAGAPILPIDDDTIISREGLYARQTGEGLEVRDASTAQLLWTDPTLARPTAFAPNRRAAALVRDGNAMREVGPEALPDAVWNAEASDGSEPTYDGTGTWLTNSEGAFVARIGLWAESPSIQGRQGTRTASGSSAIPEVVNFVTLDIVENSYTAAQWRDHALLTIPAEQLRQRFYLNRRATVDAFLAEIRRDVSAVGFLGHSVELDPYGSVGLQFPNPDPVAVNPYLLLHKPSMNAILEGFPYKRVVEKLESQARIVFIGACQPMSRFEQLWGFDNATKGRGLVVANTKDVRQGVAGEAWLRILQELRAGNSLKAAVQTANAKVIELQAGGFFLGSQPSNGVMEQWRVVGGEEGAEVFLK